MAKDKKAKKGDKPEKATRAPKSGKAVKPGKLAKVEKKAGKALKAAEVKFEEVASRPHPLEALGRLADHPLVAELLAVGALAAVAAVADAASRDPAAARSADSARKAGKAAATAIGARILKEFSGSGKKDGEGQADTQAKQARRGPAERSRPLQTDS